MLDLYVASRTNEIMQQQRAKQQNLDSLGPAGPQRIEAVCTWLGARLGAEGKAMANVLRQFPVAGFVKGYENLIRQFSGQGGAEFSQSHRAGQEDRNGRIENYDSMSFVGRRVAQMQQQFGRRSREKSA